MCHYAFLVLLASLIAAGPAYAQSDVRTAALDVFVSRFEPLEGGARARLWVSDRTAATARVSLAREERDPGTYGGTFSTFGRGHAVQAALGVERRIGRAGRPVTPFLAAEGAIGYGTFRHASGVRHGLPYEGERFLDFVRATTVGAAAAAGVEVRLYRAASVTLSLGAEVEHARGEREPEPWTTSEPQVERYSNTLLRLGTTALAFSVSF